MPNLDALNDQALTAVDAFERRVRRDSVLVKLCTFALVAVSCFTVSSLCRAFAFAGVTALSCALAATAVFVLLYTALMLRIAAHAVASALWWMNQRDRNAPVLVQVNTAWSAARGVLYTSPRVAPPCQYADAVPALDSLLSALQAASRQT